MLQFLLIADSSVNKFESYLLNQCYFFNTLLFHELTSSISKQIGHNRPIVLCGNILYSNSFLPGRSQGFANLRTSYRSRDHADFSLRYLCRKTYNATQLHMKYICNLKTIKKCCSSGLWFLHEEVFLPNQAQIAIFGSMNPCDAFRILLTIGGMTKK